MELELKAYGDLDIIIQIGVVCTFPKKVEYRKSYGREKIVITDDSESRLEN